MDNPKRTFRAGEDIGRGMTVKVDEPKGELVYLCDVQSMPAFVAPEDIKVGQMIEVNLVTREVRVLPVQK
jgi:hypothetical protein